MPGEATMADAARAAVENNDPAALQAALAGSVQDWPGDAVIFFRCTDGSELEVQVARVIAHGGKAAPGCMGITRFR